MEETRRTKRLPATAPWRGEGNYTAARAYDRDQKQFAESGKVEPAARKAEESLEGDKAELAEAEAEGRKHGRGEDPALKREKR